MTISYFWVFGQRLSSNISFPELRSAPSGPVRWRFRVVEDLPPARRAVLLGEEPIYASVAARLFRHDGGYRIEVDDTGVFDLTEEGGSIRWMPRDDPWWDFGRSHLIGRVLTTSLQLAGVVTLHGSAVELGDGVVGFLGPKHFGKSTLAMRLVESGARLVTDDALPVDLSDGSVRVLPGIQSFRVSEDDLDRTPSWLGRPGPTGRDGKVILPPLPTGQVTGRPSALSSLYFLNPPDPSRGPAAVCRRASPQVPSTVRLLSQMKIASMLGSGFACSLLDAAADITSMVPSYELSIVRDLERLPEVVDRLLEWHGVGDGEDRPVRG